MCVRSPCCSIQIFSEHDEAAAASGAIAAGYTMMQPAAPLQHVMENRGPLYGTAVFVDTFHRVPWLPGGVFFLTHAHTDHMSGLGRSWRVGKLHCSRMTSAFLIARQMCVPDIIRAHDLDTQFDVEDPLHARRTLTGVFVDAGHCPGSVILVLKGLPGGPVILTGDFRFNKDHLHNSTLAGIRCRNPTLYLDVTFASRHPACWDFPEKSAAISQVLDLLDKHSGGETIFMRSGGLGDEELLVAVANYIRPDGEMLHFACARRFAMFKVFDPEFCRRSCALLTGSQRRQQHRVIVVNSASCAERLREEGVIGVEVSCSTLWWVRGPHALSASQPVWAHNIWHVLWSMHSSFSELRMFVDWMKPKCILPSCLSFCPEGAVQETCDALFGDLLGDHICASDSASGDGDVEDAAATARDVEDAKRTARETSEFFSVTRPERPACTLERLLDSQVDLPVARQPSPLRQPASGGCLVFDLAVEPESRNLDVEDTPAVDLIGPIHVDDEADDEDDDFVGPDDSILVAEANLAAARKRRVESQPTAANSRVKRRD